MACPGCLERSALVAALAPAIYRLPGLTRQDLLGLLAFPQQRLLRAAGVVDVDRFSSRVRVRELTASVPSALCSHDPDYPRALAALESAPAILYATCTTERLDGLLAAPTVALVGNLIPTAYARRVAFALARDLAAAGVTVLSGLNDGVEGVVHRGVLRTRDGRGVAVLPCTPDGPPFPDRDTRLHRAIVTRGGAVSEFPPGFHPPPRWCYIASQRITAALADVVVVIEANDRSSALFTVQIAADLGHEVAVVPGRVTDRSARGTFGLLRDGAHPVSSARDVLELLHEGSRPQELTATSPR